MTKFGMYTIHTLAVPLPHHSPDQLKAFGELESHFVTPLSGKILDSFYASWMGMLSDFRGVGLKCLLLLFNCESNIDVDAWTERCRSAAPTAFCGRYYFEAPNLSWAHLARATPCSHHHS